MIIDSHAHILINDPIGYPVAPLSGALRDGDLDQGPTAEQLLDHMDVLGVDRAILVQRAHVFGYDNSYVVDSAARYPRRFSAVVMVDGLSAGAAEQVQYWVKERGAVGIRLAASSRSVRDTLWMSAPTAEQAWRAAAELGVSVCLHVMASMRLAVIEAAKSLMRTFTSTPVVLDHLTNAPLEPTTLDRGFDRSLESLQGFSNAYLKFSTLNLKGFDKRDQAVADIFAYITQRFPVERLMWGSDIGQSRESYEDMVGMAQRAIQGLSAENRTWALGRACQAVYGR